MDKANRTKYHTAAHDIAKLVVDKQEAYGDSFGKAGQVLNILYPDGISPAQQKDALTVVRVVDKLMRVATRKDAFGESPWRDIAGYALLSVVRDQQATRPRRNPFPNKKEIHTKIDSYFAKLNTKAERITPAKVDIFDGEPGDVGDVVTPFLGYSAADVAATQSMYKALHPLRKVTPPPVRQKPQEFSESAIDEFLRGMGVVPAAPAPKAPEAELLAEVERRAIRRWERGGFKGEPVQFLTLRRGTGEEAAFRVGALGFDVVGNKPVFKIDRIR